jgi:dipeptidyl aminopeptidase/acylaminoacyl peptidase
MAKVYRTRSCGLSGVVLAAGFAVAGFAAGASAQSMTVTRQAVAPAGAAAPAAAGVDADALAKTPLISRAVLFGNPERAAGRLSPDGKMISYLAAVDGVLNVWVAPVGDLSAAKAVTRDTNRGIRSYFWAYDNAHIVYLQDEGGDENWRVHSVNVATGEHRDLTPMAGVAAQIEGVSEKFPGEILVGLNNRNPQLHDLWRVNIATGEKTLVKENPGFAGMSADDNFVPRFGSAFMPDGGVQMFTLKEGEEPQPWIKVEMEDTLTTSPMGFDATGTKVYMSDSRGRNTAALVEIDLTTGAEREIARDAKADVGGVLEHPTTKQVQAVSFTYDRTRWEVIDQSIAADLAYLATVADGEMSVTSRTEDDTKWTVAYVLDNGPAATYLYERDPASGKAGTATRLFSNRPNLEGQPLVRMHPAVIPSRDGLNLVSYLTLPLWADADQDGRAERAAPLVLVVHGGPWARDDWGFDPYHQWLANRGYAVLSVNFRGSTGFGKDFINAGNKEWAAKMHDDLLDAVDWAVANGAAQRDKVAIMGGSYGGYAALTGVTFTPDVFACAVSIVGPSSLVTLLNSIPPYWAPAIELFAQRVGDHRTEEGRAFLESRSPLTFVDRITKPLLIGQGANDPRVKQAESDQIVAAMQAKNIPVSYVLFPDEGHGFNRPENNMAFNAVVEAFLAQHLGGRYEPVGEDLAKSTAIIPAGADQIPGLSGAAGVRTSAPEATPASQ